MYFENIVKEFELGEYDIELICDCIEQVISNYERVANNFNLNDILETSFDYVQLKKIYDLFRTYDLANNESNVSKHTIVCKDNRHSYID